MFINATSEIKHKAIRLAVEEPQASSDHLGK
jgi:hypothetical protein